MLQRTGAAIHLELNSFQHLETGVPIEDPRMLNIDEPARAQEAGPAGDTILEEPLRNTPGKKKNRHLGEQKLIAKLSRARTHNEQLCVACCGVMLGRANLF